MKVEVEFNSKPWLRWEKRCVKRALKGDPEAFAELYRAFAQPLYSRLLLPRLGNREAAQDALAETFRTALERLADFSYRDKSIWYWLSRIASNKAADIYRVQARTTRALCSFEKLMVTTWESPLRADHESEREERARVMRDSLERVLARLTSRYQRAIQLRFFEEREREECARLLEVKLGTFDVLLLRALRALRREWDSEIGIEPEALKSGTDARE